jgi:hypothetical protein
MLIDQYFLRPEESVSDASGQVPLRTCAEFVRSYNAEAPEIVNAITAAVLNAQAGLSWLGAQPRDLEEVQRALRSTLNECKRAAEIVVRLRALMKEVPAADGASDH